ncbi:5-formyltetrahydrofolate cyclo-ligase [Marinospirillum alkaliphilum]|uniref:5-formyltetrahydrofolate cyclo-ligase n=1 Tax=Marinospirillum alkaliphilum DSM 21637 TaxID=1122209 RepID=A0A1K1WQ89_9GAMM|nr:5-formyltetrahydrofolate cyclo-ligase [Marinospirillum alkaliphilum]SFX39510.1 5-formyltetrahydrofolate cyclo-ligase [Marinospirillum alkaliphilum DSM 21637]
MPAATDTSPSRKTLRQQLRNRRRNLSIYTQKQAASGICRVLRQQRWFQRAKHLAVYLASDGEVDPQQLIRLAHQLGKKVYLPVLHPLQRGFLCFVRYDTHTPMQANRFGIHEPRLRGYGHLRQNQRKAQALNLVLMPLVGFDLQGGRLGMGGGFYDRTFAARPAKFNQPLLIGLAHDCQRVEHLSVADWDVPLAGVVTGSGFYPSV